MTILRITIAEMTHLLPPSPFLTLLQPQWPCWFQNIPGLAPLHLFPPAQTNALPSCLASHPLLQDCVHILLSCSGFYHPPIYSCILQLLASRVLHLSLFTSIAPTIICLTIYVYFICYFPHKNVNIMRTEIFIYLVTAGYIMKGTMPGI